MLSTSSSSSKSSSLCFTICSVFSLCTYTCTWYWPLPSILVTSLLFSEPNPLCLSPFPTPSLNLLFSTPLPQTIFTMTLLPLPLLCWTFPLPHSFYLQHLYFFQNPTLFTGVLALPLSLDFPSPPFLPENLFSEPFLLGLFPQNLGPPAPSSASPSPLALQPFDLPLIWQECLNLNCLLPSSAFGAWTFAHSSLRVWERERSAHKALDLLLTAHSAF